MSERLCLELISKRAYEGRERFWGDNRNNWDSSHQVYGHITNPIVAQSYEALIERLAGEPELFKIRVRNAFSEGPAWLSYYPERLPAAKDEIAMHARADSHKRDFLNVFLSRPNWRQQDAAVLEFAEVNGKVVGYKVFAPRVSHELFGLPKRGYVRFISGLADPACVLPTQGALEKTLVLPVDQHIARTG